VDVDLPQAPAPRVDEPVRNSRRRDHGLSAADHALFAIERERGLSLQHNEHLGIRVAMQRRALARREIHGDHRYVGADLFSKRLEH
jgi:hypothetical protein